MPPAGALAIDASEWFHDPALRSHVSARHWRRLAPRAGVALCSARTAMEAHGVRATWFVPGGLAVREPQLLRELAAAGHEVGLAGVASAPLASLRGEERERAQRAWLQDLAAIESATGVAVRGFRSPWPTGEGEAWWRPWLAAAGLAYDASVARDVPGSQRVRSFAGPGEADVTAFAAWQLDPEQPRLVGLPRAVFADHYGRLEGAAAAFAGLLQRAGGPIGPALGIPAAAPVERAVPAVAAVARNPGAVRLAVVVPLKDEAEGIASLAVELAEVERGLADVAACEFVFVDDGSTDHTWELLTGHFGRLPTARLVRHPHNRGVAAAIRSGLAATDAELVASIDGDLSYDPMELRAMLALAPTADVVTASPYHPRGGVRNVPGWRLALSRTLSFAYRTLTRSPVHTWTSCFRVYRRAAVVDLPLANPGFLGTAELLVRVLRRGGRVVEHPCVLEARLFGVSKMRVLRTIAGHLRLLWLVLWRRVR